MEWFENETFWRDLYGYMFPAERMAAAPAQVEQVLALARLNSGAVLDLCCGPGRHSVEFARRGFNVTGVDRSPFLLERAREHATEAAATVEWVIEDMRSFVRESSFELACNLFTSFGYFEHEQEDLEVLRNVHRSLRPGGVFILEMLGKERLARILERAVCTDLGDGALLLQRHEIRSDWSRVRNEWILLKDGRYRTFPFEHTVYSGRELKERLFAAGFAEVELFGGLEGTPYDVDANRLVAVARKRV
ncbi:MAG TPA: class I SAM-dependent methyltransferase [Bryobacteraceae bacterium]|nr:class I SAM-dependent methyltransferase [Bryobacteraceae bacterium]